MAVAMIVGKLLYFYSVLIVVYVLMSWFPISGVFAEIYNVLGSIVEPYLSIFRRFIPPVGAVDISPMVAILVLMAVQALL